MRFPKNINTLPEKVDNHPKIVDSSDKFLS